jgi:hypothetical protein
MARQTVGEVFLALEDDERIDKLSRVSMHLAEPISRTILKNDVGFRCISMRSHREPARREIAASVRQILLLSRASRVISVRHETLERCERAFLSSRRVSNFIVRYASMAGGPRLTSSHR